MSKHSIIPASLAITSMRDSGYKTAAHAIAELIDNSIQATAKTVQLICVDKSTLSSQRRMKYVEQVAIFDDGKGMQPHTLQQALQFGGGAHRNDPNGIGKFGMGLPSATISQCRRLDVYSWQNGECYYTYLDVGKVEAGELNSVPEPVAKKLPSMWLEAIGEDYNSEHGTIAIWSDLDRVTWKTSKSLYIHSEKLIGRMYRHFIANKQITVRFKSFVNDVTLIKDRNELFKVNDPLFLYKNTILPELPGDYKNESFFEQFGDDQVIPIELNNGKKGDVVIKYSRVVKPIHQAILRESSVDVGRTPFGRLAAENNGVSITRSNREIKMTDIFNSTDPRDRWFGVEVAFTPVLDELFGVTFDKQDVVNFELIDLKTEAENEGYDSEDKSQMREFEELFNKEKTDRYWIYKIATEIRKNITSLRTHTTSLKDGALVKKNSSDTPRLTHAEEVAKKVADKRISEKKATDSDLTFHNPEVSKEDKEIALSKALEKDNIGIDKEEAKEVAKALIKNDCNVKFLEQPLRGSVFFDVASEAGTVIVLLNTNHEFYKFYNGISDDKKELMKLVLIAWAQCEDESSSRIRSDMEDVRAQWGKMMKDYLYELND